MKLKLYNGRTKAYGPATDVDGNDIDDWGFEGPVLENVEFVTVTYMDTFRVKFTSVIAANLAKAQTGWQTFSDDDELEMELTGDVVSIFSLERDRHDYFGDWSVDA